MINILSLFSLIAVSTICYFIFLYFVNKTDGCGVQIGGYYSLPSTLTKTKKKGIKAERLVNGRLRILLKKGEYLLSNLIIPTQEGLEYEIDGLLISKKGIFCIETKDWKGTIIGCNKDSCWIQRFDYNNGISRKIHNPVKQNAKHCELLEELLDFQYPVDNIIIFASSNNLRCIQSKYVFSIGDFKKCYSMLEENQLSKNQITKVVDKLCPYIANVIA